MGNVNAGIAKGLVEACAKHCPEAILGMIVNPVNSVVPAMAELYEKKGLDPRKVIGVTTLDCVRANKFVAGATDKPPSAIRIPVVGGHAGKTILPLFSQDRIGKTLTAEQVTALDVRTQDGGNEVLAGLGGKKTVECAYVKQTVNELPFFSSKVTFGKTGVEKVHDVGTMSEYETTRFAEVCAQLKTEIQTGLDYAKEQA